MRICLKCKVQIKAESYIGHEHQDYKPAPGDYTVCDYCCTIGTFDKDLNIDPIPKLELLKMMVTDYPTWFRLTTLRSALIDYKYSRKNKN